MKMFPRAAAVLAAALVGLTGLVGFSSPASATEGQKPFEHTFTIENGKAVATVTPTRDLATAQEVTLVSYFAPKPNFDIPQYVFQSKTGVLKDKDGVVTLTVDVPDCNTQVDLFFGGKADVIDPLDGTKYYGNRKLGEKGAPGNLSKGPAGWFNGGNKACVQPAVQPVALCDGSVDLQLSNNGQLSKYDVTFRVTAAGFEKTVKVAAGKGETVHVPAGAGAITVSAPQMADATFTWARPDTCVPTAAAESDCKNVTVTVTNPEGNAPAKAEVTYGTETKSTTVAPGKSELVTFTAGSATTATVKYPEITGTQPVTVTVKKGVCEPTTPATTKPATTAPTTGVPSATPSQSVPTSTSASTSPVETTPVSGDGGGDGQLPLTGSAAAGVAGGAFLLLVAGAVLYLLARRRKVNFTA